MRISRSSVPTHWKLAKLTTGLSAVSTCVISPGSNVVMTVPSFGAVASRWRTDVMLAAPGMFCTITFGLPGMWRP